MATWLKFEAESDKVKNGVWWMIHDMRRGVKDSKQFQRDVDWEIVYSANFDLQGHVLVPKRFPMFVTSLERGDVLPPIAIFNPEIMLDGAHKHKAYHTLHSSIIPLMRPAGLGYGKIVRDEVYAPLIKGFKPKKRPPMKCISCFSNMEEVPKEFICRSCGHTTSNINVLGRVVIK